MSRLRNYCVYGLLLGILGAAGCEQAPVAPTDPGTPFAATAPGTSVATPVGKPAPGPVLAEGFYEMTFLNGARQPVTTLPIGPGSNLLVKVHVEDSAHQPAKDGSVLFEVCRYKGVSPTTGTRGGAAPSARCTDGSGLARWERWTSVELLPSGDAYAGVDFVNVACVMGWRAKYSGSRTIASHTMGPADITWQ